MSDDRNAMIRALQDVLVPVLRARGFRGSVPHFRRLEDARIDLLTIQFDRYGGGFVVEIAKCPLEGVVHPNGKRIEPSRVTAQDVSRRLRLGARSESGDHWFRYDTALDRLAGDRRFGRRAQEVVALLDRQAEPWWENA